MGLRALAAGGVYLCGGIMPKARAPGHNMCLYLKLPSCDCVNL